MSDLDSFFRGDCMSISNLYDDVRRIVITGPLCELTAVQFLDQITAMELRDPTQRIKIYINSYGGCVDSMVAIYDIMRSCRSPIETIGVGAIMSASVLLLAAGDKGMRSISKHSRVMIHQVAGSFRGTASEMAVNHNEMKRQQQLYIDLLALHTGKKTSQIKADMENEMYMTSDQAIKYNIADKVLYHSDFKTKNKRK